MKKRIFKIVENQIEYWFGNTYAGEIMEYEQFVMELKKVLFEENIEIRPFELFHIVIEALYKHGRYVDFCDGTAYIMSKGAVLSKDCFNEIREGDHEHIHHIDINGFREFLIADKEYVLKRAKELRILKRERKKANC